MSPKVLHLLGSPTDQFSFEVSMMYSKSLAKAGYEDTKDYTNLYAVVHPDESWSFPSDITEEDVEDGKTYELTAALGKVKEMNPDLMVQHILCAKRPLYNAMFEILGIPFIGSSSQVSANIVDKGATRALLLQAGLPVPHGAVVVKGDTSHNYSAGFPAVVKPCKMENSVGVEIVRNKEEMKKALVQAFGYGDTAVVDTFIPGREIRCGVAEIDGELQALPCLEYRVDTHGVRGYSDKLEGGEKNLKFAASTRTWFVNQEEEAQLLNTIQEVARRVHRVLQCRDFSQIDCRVSLTGEVFILEVNSFCSFGPLSLMTKLADKQGIRPGQFYKSMVNNVISRSRKSHGTGVMKSG